MPAGIELNSAVVVMENGQQVAEGTLVAVDEETGEYGIMVEGQMIRVRPDGQHQVVPAGGNNGNQLQGPQDRANQDRQFMG